MRRGGRSARRPAAPPPAVEPLVTQGAEFGAGRVLLIACGALAREIIAINHANGAEHFTLRCLPAILHNHPERIAPAVEAEIARGRAEGFADIFVLYADCGTGGALDRVCAAAGVERIAGPHCYAFFDGVERFAARGEMRAFYLTDFLARQFDAFVTKPLGLDRHPELAETYFGNYDSLVYLAQTEDPALDDAARAAAATLGLAYERRSTGYGDLAADLARR
ncbi:DUF1638 domain-containing protein [Pontivivens ytuae]|uniref:DUF1638 domain-containing protein n=1 Tax=Pontivivens ytuae TaxID=2789856 RepID=UPI003BAE9C64